MRRQWHALRLPRSLTYLSRRRRTVSYAFAHERSGDPRVRARHVPGTVWLAVDVALA